MKTRHIKKIVENKKDKTILSKERVILYSSAISLFANDETPPTDYVYFGTVQVASELPMLFNYHDSNGAVCSLPLNKGVIEQGFKKYENILFDQLFCENISEDTEIVFYGFKFMLQSI